MTPDEAAAMLGVGRDADEAEIEHAYRRLARELHPDRLAGSPESSVKASSERFVDLTTAHDLLLASARARARLGAARASGRPDAVPRPRVPDGAAASPAGPAAVQPFGWWLFSTWTLLLVVGAAFSISGLPVWGPVDLWLRVVLLVAFAIATGLTGRRWVWRVTLVLIGVNAVATVLATTFGGLLGLGFMIVASFGLAVQAGLVRFPDQ